MLAKILLLICLMLYDIHCEENRPLVKTPLGKVKGYVRSANKGRKFSLFEGIPYAKAPIGERRFEAPEPIEPWSGTWDAIFVTQCVQTALLKLTNIEGEEDCLYVNVYVPREKPDPKEKLDVIVHIHGGAYMYGSGHSYAHPDFIMDNDVIFVTFNYRLGIFGFLSTEDEVVPGNNGLKDQVLALKWIQKNIASFGGNPDSVTLTGLSAGGSSVHLHYLSDMSKGLFHRGFSQSGVALNSWSLQEGALTKAKILANAVGCSDSDSRMFVECLKQKHWRHLITKMYLFFGYLSLPISPFAPVVEKGSSPFINKHPYEQLASGQIQDLPWIVSNTAHEGMLPAAYFYRDLKTVEANWTSLAPFLLDYNYTLPESKWKETAESIKNFYLGDKNIGDDDNFLKVVEIFSDRLFVLDAESAVKLQAQASTSPVYYYHFNYPNDHNPGKTTAHADDAQYFFFNMFNRKQISPNEIKMKDVMIDMLMSYAATGKPSVKDVEWTPTGSDKVTYLKIDGFEPGDITLETVDELTPRKFWQSIGLHENENLLNVKDEL